MCKEIPLPAKRRLVLLRRMLSVYPEKMITSQKIEALTGWASTVVRKDISFLSLKCGARNGYSVEELKLALSDALKVPQSEQKCCLVGLGRMGQILLDNAELEHTAFRLVAGFDSNVNRTEVLRSAFPLHPTTMLESVIREEEIRFAILTVPAKEAQALALRLSESGIRGIVNYTPAVLALPPTVTVENVGLLTALEMLSATEA